MANTPRDAATVVLARPTPDGAYEVLLTRRPESMAFMGGTYVFPGGALDDGDAGDALIDRSAISPADALERLGEDIDPRVAVGLYCCAVRELFEEVGVLLARDASGAPVDPDVVRERFAPRQSELAHDPDAFAAFCGSEGLTLATDLLVPHGRLVTPEMSPIRFDARFFVAPFPDGQEVVPDPVEVPEYLWMRPGDAIRAAGDESLPIPIPTMSILQGVAEVPGYEQLLAGRVRRREVQAAPLSPTVFHVLAPNPGLATGPGTNTYVVGTGDVAIVDPAVPDPVYIEVLVREAGNRGTPKLVLITHTHPDHIGGAAVLGEQLGVPVAVWEGVAGDHSWATRPIADGDSFRVGGATLTAVHTPGHASDHVCFRYEEEGSLFAGDMVAGIGTVVIAPPDGDMADYLDSLHRLRELGVGRIYPGHGPAIEDGDAKLAEYIEHRHDRERQVVGALEAGHSEIPAMVEHIYTDVPTSLHPMAEMSVRAHLDMLERNGRVRRDGESWRLA